MYTDPFTNPFDWYHANKHWLPDTFAIFEHPHVAFIFKWKEIEALLLPHLRLYSEKYYPETVSSKKHEPEFEKILIRCIFTLVESVCKTMQYSAAGKKLPLQYPDMYPLMPVAIKFFKMQDRFISPDNEPEWLQMIKDEKEKQTAIEEENAIFKQAVAERKEFIDTVQPVMIQTLPGILNIEGEWWLKYEFDYVFSYNRWYDSMNRLRWTV